jgi:hypothetical protein
MLLELGILALLAFIVLVIIGIVVIVIIIGSLIMFLPATVIAVVVLFLTHSWFWAGVAFLAVAVFMLIFKR